MCPKSQGESAAEQGMETRSPGASLPLLSHTHFHGDGLGPHQRRTGISANGLHGGRAMMSYSGYARLAQWSHPLCVWDMELSQHPFSQPTAPDQDNRELRAPWKVPSASCPGQTQSSPCRWMGERELWLAFHRMLRNLNTHLPWAYLTTWPTALCALDTLARGSDTVVLDAA